MMKIASHPRFLRLAALLAVDGLVFGLSDPQNAPSFMLIVGFLLLAFNIYYLITNCLRISNWYGFTPGKHHRRFARTTAGLLSGLIALQSIGELGSRDILLMLPLVLLTYLYMSYGKAQTAKQPAGS